jgi:hypothetical protein
MAHVANGFRFAYCRNFFKNSNFLLHLIHSSEEWYIISEEWYIISEMWYMISEEWYITSEMWYMISEECYIISEMWYMISEECYIISEMWYMISEEWYDSFEIGIEGCFQNGRPDLLFLGENYPRRNFFYFFG